VGNEEPRLLPVLVKLPDVAEFAEVVIPDDAPVEMEGCELDEIEEADVPSEEEEEEDEDEDETDATEDS
jgi:hypothetical protein